MVKEKVTIEYCLNNASPNSVWDFISSANGRTYTFHWAASQQTARQTGYLNGVFVRFKWTDEEDPKAFFEFRINVDELTSNVTLEITDFTLPEEKQECVDLWNEQISTLRRKLGS